jgi:hypothetical protein
MTQPESVDNNPSINSNNDNTTMSKQPFEHQPGRGSLFVNDRKQKDTHPDWKGEINIDGKIYEIASWWKEGKKGGFHSLLVTEKKPFEPGETRDRGQRQERRSQWVENSQAEPRRDRDQGRNWNRREKLDDVFPDEQEGGW